MNKIRVLGIGGIGASMAEEVTCKLTKENLPVTSIAIDTDKFHIRESNCTHIVDISYPTKMGDMLSFINENGINLFGEEDFSKLGYILSLSMDKGANAWRLKAFATFVAYMLVKENKDRFNNLLDKLFSDIENDEKLSFYVITSLAGGTGSALCLPISLYVKNYLREKGINEVESTLFAVCPDIFAETMNLEMKTKAYANAYATLSEINDINKVILNKQKQPIKIGFEDEKSFGLLFDTNNGKYLAKTYIPFNKIILFDKMPGVSSVDFHVNVFASYVYHYCLGYTVTDTIKQNKEIDLFKAYSVVEIDYSVDNVIDYIAKYKVNQTIKNEILDFYKKIEKFNIVLSSDKLKKVENYEIENFINKLDEFFENNDVRSDDKSAYVLNRFDKDSDLTPYIDDTSWLDKYFNEMSVEIYNLIKDGSYEDFCEKLNVKNYKRINTNDFVNKTEELYAELTDLYYEMLDNAIESDCNLLYLSTENQVFSIINNLLKDGDNFIHPTLALIRLSQLYDYLKGKVTNKYFYKQENLEYDEDKKLIPNEFLKILNYERGNKGYGELGGDRFKRIVAKIENKVDLQSLSRFERKRYLKELKNYAVKNARIDKKFVLSDFNAVLENISTEIRSIYLIKLFKIVENLILSYRKTFSEISLYSYKLENEVKVSKKEKVTEFVYYGVGTSTKNRDLSVKQYLSSVNDDNIVCEDDILGEILFNYNLSKINKSDDDIDASVEQIIDQFINKILEVIKNSNYYKTLKSKNVFSALFGENGDKKEQYNFKLSMKMESNVLLERSSKIIDKKTLFISPEIAKYLQENKTRFNLKSNDLQEIIDEFLINLGEYSTQAVFNENISNNKAYVCVEKCGFSFNDLSKINKNNNFAIYLKEYNKSLNNIEKFNSIMWNPHIFN